MKRVKMTRDKKVNTKRDEPKNRVKNKSQFGCSAVCYVCVTGIKSDCYFLAAGVVAAVVFFAAGVVGAGLVVVGLAVDLADAGRDFDSGFSGLSAVTDFLGEAGAFTPVFFAASAGFFASADFFVSFASFASADFAGDLAAPSAPSFPSAAAAAGLVVVLAVVLTVVGVIFSGFLALAGRFESAAAAALPSPDLVVAAPSAFESAAAAAGDDLTLILAAADCGRTGFTDFISPLVESVFLWVGAAAAAAALISPDVSGFFSEPPTGFLVSAPAEVGVGADGFSDGFFVAAAVGVRAESGTRALPAVAGRFAAPVFASVDFASAFASDVLAAAGAGEAFASGAAAGFSVAGDFTPVEAAGLVSAVTDATTAFAMDTPATSVAVGTAAEVEVGVAVVVVGLFVTPVIASTHFHSEPAAALLCTTFSIDKSLVSRSLYAFTCFRVSGGTLDASK